MTVPVKITIKEKRPPGVSARKWRVFTKESWAIVGNYWHEHMLEDHFRPDAKYRYHYQRRASKYIAKKLALAKRGDVEGGGRTDLVFKGDLKEFVTSLAYVQAFPARAKLVMKAPSYVTSKPKGGRPWMAQEVSTVLEGEKKKLGKIQKEHIVNKMNSYSETKTTTI